MDFKASKLSGQFHLSIVSKCCQICGRFQESRSAISNLLDAELKKVFPEISARGLSSRLSQLTCAACFAKVQKFRGECKANLGASRNMSKEEKLAVLVSTRCGTINFFIPVSGSVADLKWFIFLFRSDLPVN